MYVIDINEVKKKDYTTVIDEVPTGDWKRRVDKYFVFDETVMDQIRVESNLGFHLFTMSQRRYKKGHSTLDKNLTIYLFEDYVSYKAGIYPYGFDELTPEGIADKLTDLFCDKSSLYYNRDIIRVSQGDAWRLGGVDWEIHCPGSLFEGLILKEVFGDYEGLPVINIHEGKDYGRIVKVAFCSPEVFEWYENKENKK